MPNESYFHVAAYSQATGAAITNTALVVVPDGILTVSGTTGFLVPSEAKMVLAASNGATLTRARLNTPSLRYVGLPSLVPVNASATIPSPVNVVNLVESPIALPKVDTVSIEATDTAADNITAAMWLMFNRREVPSGKRYRLRGTAAIAGVLNAWANGAITLDQVLPQGQYVIVGMDVVAANVLAARLVFAGTGYRPGCLARNAVGSIQHPIFSDGRLGCYGMFENANLPNLEILLGAGGASAAQEVFLDVIRLGDV